MGTLLVHWIRMASSLPDWTPCQFTKFAASLPLAQPPDCQPCGSPLSRVVRIFMFLLQTLVDIQKLPWQDPN